MKYLGIDYGTKGIGIAISDERGGFAFPKETIANGAQAVERIAEMVVREKVEAIVFGDTRAINGRENLVTPEAEKFAEALEVRAAIPVYRVNEAWSTVEAARYAPKGKEHDDAAAAAIILQRYLDVHTKTD